MGQAASLCAAGVLLTVSGWADDAAEDKAYKALKEIVQLSPTDPKADDCVVKGVADFGKFSDKLPIFRDAFLNRDYSVDFYDQRRKQVFSFVVLKRAAELATEAMYNGHSQPECRYSFTISYPDKFGQERNFEALTWRFNDAQSVKVNWQKFDARNFADIALDYEIKPAVMKWISDEPRLGDSKPASAASEDSTCDMLLFNANAIFIRATTFCRKDYMDSQEGMAALEGGRKCQMPEAEMKAKVSAAMLTLDKIARQHGKAAVCPFVEEVAREVREKTR